MKYLIITLALIFTSSSMAFFATESDKQTERKREEMFKEYKLLCAKMGSNIIRCENKEVVCYGSNAGYSEIKQGKGGISCQFKK